jgi:MFS family permease
MVKDKKIHSDKSLFPVVLSALATAFSLLGDMAVYAILPVYYNELGLTEIHVGILLSANRWIRIFTNHLADNLVRKYRVTRLFAFALILGAMLPLVYGQFPVFWVLLIGRLLWGLCWSLIRHLGIMLSINNSNSLNRGQAVGIYDGLSRIGSIVGTILGGFLFDSFGYRLAFFILSGISFLGLPLGIAAGRTEPKIPSSEGFYSNSKGVLHKGFIYTGFVVGCVGPGIIMSTVGYLLNSRLGTSISLGSLVIGITTLNGIILASRHIINTVGAPVIGITIDKIGHRASILIFLGLGTVLLFFISLISNVFILISLVILLFASGVVIQVSLSSEAGKLGSRAYARLATALDVGSASGPLIGWFLVALFSSPVAAFPVGGVLYFSALLILLLSS